VGTLFISTYFSVKKSQKAQHIFKASQLEMRPKFLEYGLNWQPCVVDAFASAVPMVFGSALGLA